MFELFPRLKERADTQAGVLSGGEQQMLTLCRTLMGDPELVMIDEPTEGLAPKIVELVAQLFEEIKKRGVSILLVEQKLAIALDISERLYVMGHGQHRVRRHAARPARERRDAQGMAGGLIDGRPQDPQRVEFCTIPLESARNERRGSLFGPRRHRRHHPEQPAGQRPGQRAARRHHRRPEEGRRRPGGQGAW